MNGAVVAERLCREFPSIFAEKLEGLEGNAWKTLEEKAFEETTSDLDERYFNAEAGTTIAGVYITAASVASTAPAARASVAADPSSRRWVMMGSSCENRGRMRAPLTAVQWVRRQGLGRSKTRAVGPGKVTVHHIGRYLWIGVEDGLVDLAMLFIDDLVM